MGNGQGASGWMEGPRTVIEKQALRTEDGAPEKGSLERQRSQSKRQGDYYSDTGKNEVMLFAETWMEMIILSEQSPTEKDNCHIIALLCGIY